MKLPESNRSTVAGVLLAAGESRRMGRVKALLPLGEDLAVRHLCHEMLRICREVAVVTGFHADAVERALAGLPRVRCVRNPQPERGQLSSLQTALRTLPAWAEWFLFAPVDCFGMGEEVLEPLALRMQSATPTELLLVPWHGDRRGHPVCARRSVATEFLQLPDDATARDAVHRLRPSTVHVPVESSRFLIDVDTPADYEAFTAAPGASRDSIEQE